MSKEYLGLYPNKREGGIYSDEPEYQRKIEEIYKLKARIAELEDELQVAVAVHEILDDRIKELEERIAFMEASAVPEKKIDIIIK